MAVYGFTYFKVILRKIAELLASVPALYIKIGYGQKRVYSDRFYPANFCLTWSYKVTYHFVRLLIFYLNNIDKNFKFLQFFRDLKKNHQKDMVKMNTLYINLNVEIYIASAENLLKAE